MPPFKLFHPLDDTPFWNVRSDVSEILILQSFCYRSYIFFQTLDPAFFRIRYPTDFEPDVLLFRIWYSAYQDVRILRFGYQILFPLFRQFPIHFFQISDPVSFLMWNPAVFFIKILSFPFRYGCFVSEIRIFYSADTKSYLCRSAAFFLEINTSFFRNTGSVFRSNQDTLPSDRKPCNIFCLNMISRFRMFFVCSVLTADLLSVLNRSSFFRLLRSSLILLFIAYDNRTVSYLNEFCLITSPWFHLVERHVFLLAESKNEGDYLYIGPYLLFWILLGNSLRLRWSVPLFLVCLWLHCIW